MKQRIMSCLLPPVCMFCRHYMGDAERDCAAYLEIPEAIMRGDCDHSARHPGDHGLQFALNEAFREDLEEVNDLRIAMGLEPYGGGCLGAPDQSER